MYRHNTGNQKHGAFFFIFQGSQHVIRITGKLPENQLKSSFGFGLVFYVAAVCLFIVDMHLGTHAS